MSRVSTIVRLAKLVEIMLGDVGLTPNQYRMLTLVDAGAPPMRELSVRLGMKPPNITALVDVLVNRGLVTRDRRDDDRRRLSLALTTAGAALLERAEFLAEDALARVASADPDEQRALLGTLDQWVPALDAMASRVAREPLASPS